MTNHITNFLNEKRLSSSLLTIKQYEHTLRQFDTYVGKVLDTVVHQDIINYFNYLLYERHLSHSSVSTIESTLRSFYSYMVTTGYTNPMVGIESIKVDKRAPVYLTKPELSSMKGAADNEDRLTLEALYDTGVRVSELINICKKDIQFDLNIIKVFGKGAKERIVIMTPEVSAELKKRCNMLSDDTKVFDYSSRTVQRHIKRLAEVVGIEKRITPHKVRHSFATHMVQDGGSVVGLQKLLGHTSLNTTQNYTHYSVDELTAMYNKSHTRAM